MTKKYRKKVEKVLREYELTFWVDMDPKDWSKVKLYQKPDRQIMTIAFTAWLLAAIVLLIVCHLISCICKCLCCPSKKENKKVEAK
jgi:hypothetical protein